MPKAAYLLACELRELGCAVTVVTLHTCPADVAASRILGIQLLRSPWSIGHRWRLPQAGVALGGLLECALHPGSLIIAIGTDVVAAYLLASPLASRVVVWECTEATVENAFVSASARNRLQRARAMLAPSAVVANNIRRHYNYRGPILKLPFWVEPPTHSDPPQTDGQAEDIDFIYLGRKDAKKGLFELIGAMARLQASGMTARLLICGTGEDGPFQAHATELQISTLVRFAYYADQREVIQALRKARWLVLPSHSEGYPLTLLEAFSQACPVITSHVGSVPEMCGDSPAALLVPPKDEDALALSMRRTLIMPPVEYAMRRAAARKLFERLSGPQVVRERVTTVLNRLMP